MSKSKIPKQSKNSFSKELPEETPTYALIEALNAIIVALAKCGIKIRDWDDRNRTVYKFKWLGGSAFFLAPKMRSSANRENIER